MKQIFHPYQVWEGYLNGVYEPCKDGREERVRAAHWHLSNASALRESMQRVTDEWVNETEHVLSDSTISHRAWLGQSACFIHCGAREDETREAWGLLNEKQRKAANDAADYVDKRWHEMMERKSGRYQMSLFEKQGDLR